MATINFPGDGQNKTFQQVLCASNLTAELHIHLTFISVFNSFLSVTAFLGNALILIALHKESSLHPPSKLLLRSLATTDLCVGLISEPLSVIYWMSEVNEYRNLCHHVLNAAMITSHILCGVSLFTMTAISVDRLLALLLGLRYRQVVTLKRTYVIVITLWVLSAVFTATWFWNPQITLWYAMLGISLCITISIFSYTKIFLTLRHHNTQFHSHVQQPHQTNQLNIARYKKAVSTAIWLQLTLVACYLPSAVVNAFVTNGEVTSSLHLAWSCSTTLVFLNSLLNPILYCWKIEEVKQAVKDTIREVLCKCFSS